MRQSLRWGDVCGSFSAKEIHLAKVGTCFCGGLSRGKAKCGDDQNAVFERALDQDEAVFDKDALVKRGLVQIKS